MNTIPFQNPLSKYHLPPLSISCGAGHKIAEFWAKIHDEDFTNIKQHNLPLKNIT